MKNGDKLRSMSDEDLATFLKNAEIAVLVPDFCKNMCWPKLDAPCRESGPGWCIWHDKSLDDQGGLALVA